MSATDLLITPGDLLKHDAVSVMKDKRKQLTEIVDSMLSKPPGPERWQDALKIYIDFNLSATPGMTAQEEVYYTIKENQAERDTRANKFAVGDTKVAEMRYQFNWPAGFKTFLEMCDPGIKQLKNIPKLRQTFPGFVIAEKY